MTKLPSILVFAQKYLEYSCISRSTLSKDGRSNSIIDEATIIDCLRDEPLIARHLRIMRPRHWFDIMLFDSKIGWFPVNIKSTTTRHADNAGGMAMCMWSLTDEPMDLEVNYSGKDVYRRVLHHFQMPTKHCHHRDYYFLVLNKDDKRIIVNSLRGLTRFTPNNNNLPFQIKWSDNSEYNPKNIQSVRNILIETWKKPSVTAKEEFLNAIRMM